MVWLKSPTVEGNEFSWLTEEGSLTERLQKEFNDVKVDVIYEGNAPEEKSNYTREVIIKSHNKPMIFARTSLKDNDLNGVWSCLKTLGQHSLANILFKDDLILRRSLLYKLCEPPDDLYSYLKSLDLLDHETIWLRKSEWEKNGKVLLLIEVFLPNLFN
ncbi:chorismate lyase [Candidatus Methylopumilus universalis]|jgi:chorismate-pyruvate lyase|uniref:chorismate--pyruvate lyase family protein n=1 Tax=Candidatus Methylopumilus universalis TaxID=2588536 RepID=UPI0011223526|nr:chorismate lyase [Candidatus Methylopumilus universalis]QDC88684.1 chorismate lyase [Candidatus Methylopumilus universalis]QDC89975.1 chorismate lyase [Candidatus Methylopumilus universalis]